MANFVGKETKESEVRPLKETRPASSAPRVVNITSSYTYTP